jgi:ABC-type sugar transport system substrate-binding protein
MALSRRLLVSAIVAALAVAIVGCGSGDPPPAQTQAANGKPMVTHKKPIDPNLTPMQQSVEKTLKKNADDE